MDEVPGSGSLGAELERSNTCAYREAGSRWAAPGERYAATAEFGRREVEELVDAWGLAATPAGELLAFDAGGHQVIRLDRELEPLARVERLRRVASSVGMSAGSDAVRPTAPRKWESLRVDPDGFLWLEPWRTHSMRGEPLTIWVVHPATGAVDSVVVEGAAPEAFLPGPAFVSRIFDDEAHVLLLRRYSLLSRRSE